MTLSEGSILVENGNRWHAKTRPVVPVSKVGAGDSFVGVFTWSMANGANWEEALKYGVAAAASAVTLRTSSHLSVLPWRSTSVHSSRWT